MTLFAKKDAERSFTREQWQAAKDRWLERRQLALQRGKLPDHPFRIRHIADGDFWECQKAKVFVRDWVERQDDTWSTQYPQWTPEEYDADLQIEPEISWDRIGPQTKYPGWGGFPSGSINEHSWEPRTGFAYYSSSSESDFHYAPGTFSTYAEAEKWLSAYLNPVSEEVYFSADGALLGEVGE